ncbi:MAG: hypothetical protein WA667_29420 [Candidatus Nitrosopolaris sp.]
MVVAALIISTYGWRFWGSLGERDEKECISDRNDFPITRFKQVGESLNIVKS